MGICVQVAALVERSIPAIGVSPCGSWSTAGRGVRFVVLAVFVRHAEKVPEPA